MVIRFGSHAMLLNVVVKRFGVKKNEVISETKSTSTSNTGGDGMKRMIDLCSGLGGASEAFVQAGWEVLRIDNNPLMSGVPHTTIRDIFDFEEWIENNILAMDHHVTPDLIWFSPPCLEFSMAYSSPRSLAHRAGEEWNPSTEILECGMRIIDLLKPKYFVIENVKGAIKYFEPLLGPPNQINQSYVLWGIFPGFVPPCFPTKHEKDKRHSPIRANIRAKVPIEISESLLKAIDWQKSILDYA